MGMTGNVTLLSAILAMTATSAAQAAPDSVSRLAAVKSSFPARPEAAFAGKGFSVDSDGKFVKIGFAFTPSLQAAKVAIESCKEEFKDGIEFFVYPGLRRHYAEGGFVSVTVDLAAGTGATTTEVRSLALNFRHNDPVCIKAIRILDPSGAEFAIRSDNVGAAAHTAGSGFNKAIAAKFKSIGLELAIDQELTFQGDGDRWHFRFRSDGTYLLFGTTTDTRTAGRFTVLGNFEILRVLKKKIELRVRGRRIESQDPWDGWLCGVLCGEPRRAISVDEKISIERAVNGGFMIRNRTRRDRRTIPFSDVQVRTSNL